MTISLVDDEQWKPLWGFPGYKISTHGRCISHWKMRVDKRGKYSGGSTYDESYIRFIGTQESRNHKGKRGYIIAKLRRQIELSKSYPLSHYNKLSEGKVDKHGIARVDFSLHKLVMWHFNYLDDNPEQIGITKEEWNSMPERARVIIRQSIEINHIDHNITNNRLDNLEYVTKVENAQSYKDSDKFQEYMKGVSKTEQPLIALP